MKLVLLAFFVVMMGNGCSRGFHRESLRESLASPQAEAEITDDEVGEVLAKKAQLPNSFRLGVFFRELPERWKSEEKELFLALKIPTMAAAFAVHPDLVGEGDFLGVRRAAARQGADALLVINGIEEVKRSPNGLAATYLLLLPSFFVKGIEVEALFLSRALLWDVRNSFLYLGAEAESEATQSFAPFAEVKGFLAENRRRSLARLTEELGRQASAMRAL
jgi:hypothetical protein